MVRRPIPPQTPSEMLTVAQLADLLGISLTVAYELAAQDRLPIPTIKVGRQYRFSRRAFENLANDQHKTALHTS